MLKSDDGLNKPPSSSTVATTTTIENERLVTTAYDDKKQQERRRSSSSSFGSLFDSVGNNMNTSSLFGTCDSILIAKKKGIAPKTANATDEQKNAIFSTLSDAHVTATSNPFLQIVQMPMAAAGGRSNTNTNTEVKVTTVETKAYDGPRRNHLEEADSSENHKDMK